MWRFMFRLASRLGLFKRKKARKQPWKPVRIDRPDEVIYL